MSMTKSILRAFALGLSVLPVLALAACGDGWEVKPYYGVPYTHDRTAGHGVEYVRSTMMPAKTTKTETLMKTEETTVAPVKAAPPPLTTGDKVFNNKQSK